MVLDKYTGERRESDDRRAWQSNLDFPFVDIHGSLVLEDRRNNAERRITYAEHLEQEHLGYQNLIIAN